MGAIFHKLCEKSEQELWDLLKEPEWTKEHAEIAYYMVEIMKAVKKMEHLKKLDEAMDEYDWQEEMMDKKKENDDEDDDKSKFARGGRRGGRRRMNYSMFDYDEGEHEGVMRPKYPTRMPNWETPPSHYGYDYANTGSGSSSGSGSMNSSGGGNRGGNFNVDYAAAQYYENKYRELLEDKWEKEKKDKDKDKDKEREPLMARMTNPAQK